MPVTKSGQVEALILPLFADPFVAQKTGERSVLVQNCLNGKDVLEIRPKKGGEAPRIEKFIIYLPAFKSLLKGMGFKQLQPSLYARFSFTETSAEAIRAGVLRKTPPKGKLAIFCLADFQFQAGIGIDRHEFRQMPCPSRSFALSNLSPSRRIIGVMVSRDPTRSRASAPRRCRARLSRNTRSRTSPTSTSTPRRCGAPWPLR